MLVGWGKILVPNPNPSTSSSPLLLLSLFTPARVAGNCCITFVSYGEYSDFLDYCGAYGTVRAYYDFRDDVKKIGMEEHMTPRQVEMALWKFDEMKGEG